MKPEIRITDDILLRDAIESDVYEYVSIPFEEELLRMYGLDMDYKTKKTIDKARLLIKEIQDNNNEWAIVFNNRFIGQVRLVADESNRKAKFAIGIFNPDFWNLGIGTQVTKKILQYGFDELNMHRIHLKVLKYNQRAIKTYLKAGFIIEGEEREAVFIKGKFETDVHMGILISEYKQLYKDE